MDPLGFDVGTQAGTPDGTQCLVCGSHPLADHVDLSPGSSRTTRSAAPVGSKLRHILAASWAPPPAGGVASVLCLPCFHLVDTFDTLEAQMEAVRRELTDKYVGHTGGGRGPAAPKKRQRRAYAKRKRPAHDDADSYIPPDNAVLDQQLGHSLDADVTQIHSLVWPTDQLQQLGEIAQQVSTQGQAADGAPGTVYDNDPGFLGPGERLRIGFESMENGIASFACAYCGCVAPSVDGLKCHAHSEHFPRVLTASIPPELGLGDAMNCGVQLANVCNAPPESAKPFACVSCDAAFKFKSNLSLHFREKHTPHKPFACADCREGFRRSMELSRHKVYYCPHRKKNLPRKKANGK